MLRRIIPAALVFCLIFSLFTACGNKKQKNNDIKSAKEQIGNLPIETDEGTKKLLDKIDDAIDDTIPDAPDDIKVTVELPEGWEDDTEENNAIAHYMKDTSLVQVIASWAPSEVKDTKALAEYELEQTSEYFEDATFSDVESYQVSGMEGSSISLVIPITKSMNQVQWYIYFEKGGKFYKIMGAYFSDDEQGKADVESIIASMKIE